MDKNVGSQSSSSGSLASHEVRFITLLSLTEIGVGSIVHGLKIPLGGHCLSLNQGFVLMQASKKAFKDSDFCYSRFVLARSVINVSLITALLKSFSPAGKKLTPMLAISVQGLLFSFGLVLGGTSFFAYLLGMILLSLWGFIQPLLMAWLFVGAHFWEAIDLLWSKIAQPLGIESVSALSMILLFILLKSLVASALVFFSSRLGIGFSENLAQKGLSALVKKKKPKAMTANPLKGTFRDLLSPLVIFSIFLSLIFAYYAKSSHVGFIWALLRPLTAAFVGFYLIRVFPAERMVELFAKNNPHRAELIRRAKKNLDDMQV